MKFGPEENPPEMIWPCFQIGTDNGHAWNAVDYDGPQDHLFCNLNISHGSPDSALVSAPLSGLAYKAGAQGILDWRGGGIVMRNVDFEHFETNGVFIQSDFNEFTKVRSLYSKYGWYVGPRSDQNDFYGFMSYLCDRSITLDGCNQPRFYGVNIVGAGTSAISPIEIRRGTSGVMLSSPWFEHLSVGYSGVDQIAFVSAGEVDGYGAGGSVSSPGAGNTAPVEGCEIINPTCFTTTIGQPFHTKYIAAIGKCRRFTLDHPTAPPGVSLANFDALVGIQAAQSPSAADTQIRIEDVSSDITLAKLYTNSGAGTPAIHIDASGGSGVQVYSTARFSFRTPGAAAGAEEIRLSQEGAVGEVWLEAPTKPSGQTVRLRIKKSMQVGSNAAAPSSLTWEAGDAVRVEDPSGHMYWVCTVGGTPGTWVKAAPLFTSTGTLQVLTTTAGAFAVDAQNALTAQAAGSTAFRATQAGTYDTTAGLLISVGMLAQSIATRSAGANTLRNVGLQVAASGGQDNRAMEITTGDVYFNLTSGLTFFQQAFKGVGTRAAAPSTGTHVAGEVVFNADPIAGGFAGWMCVTGGSPGTWKAFGAIAP